MTCRGCGLDLHPENEGWCADGCPCNSPRGVNHGLVPETTCTCEVCDPEKTGAVRQKKVEREETWRDRAPLL